MAESRDEDELETGAPEPLAEDPRGEASEKPAGHAAAPVPSETPQAKEGTADPKPAQKSGSLRVAPKWLGKRVGRFRLQALLGQGAVGRVFRAEDTTLHRRVALKLINTHDRDGQINPQADQFLTEARAAAALEHPHIVQIFEAGESGSLCYIAMELLEGGSLRDLVSAAGPMEPHRACQLAAEAAEALEAAHAVGIIHRDVKPANLMLSRHGRCKVTDFGLATMADVGAPLADRERAAGTPFFAAPEVIRGTSADERSDIYSLGATLFFLLTGRPPFLGPTRSEVLRAHVNQPVPDLRQIRPGLPEPLVAAVERSLDKDPGRRFESSDQFSRVLRVFTIPVAAGMTGGLSGGSSGTVALGMSGSGALAQSEPLSASDMFTDVSRPAGRGAVGAGLSAELEPGVSSVPDGASRAARAAFALRSPVVWASAAGAVVVLLFLIWLARRPSAAPVVVTPTMQAIPATPVVTAPIVPTPTASAPPTATPAPAVAPPAAPVPVSPVAAAPAESTSTLPPGTFAPDQTEALKAIGAGKDPAHRDKKAVVQGTVTSAAASASGKVFRMEFAGASGADAFVVVYFPGDGLFDKMAAKFGGDDGADLAGKRVRVEAKITLFHGTPEMVLTSPSQLRVLSP